MVILGIDAHKRTHTVVAVDEVGRQLAQSTVHATTAGSSRVCCGGLISSAPSGGGRWRTAGICRGVWRPICWPRVSGSCGSRRS